MNRLTRLAAALCALLLSPIAGAVNIHDTRMLMQPAISANRIAFAYANDLWTANPDGSGVNRLTSHPGVEGNPRFSPDGKWIAFSGEYDGNTDVFVVPAEGGVPQRLTWHPGEDLPLAFTNDSSAVLFSSPREVYTMRYRQLYTVPVAGGAVTKLPIPHATEAAYSPDGARIIYQPLGEPFTQWKNYRGGQNATLLLFDNKSYAVEQVPQPKGRSNDTDPMWIADTVYFLSDRDGEFNLYSYDRSKQVRQLTRFNDFPIVNASAGAGKIIFEKGGYLHTFDPATSAANKLKIGVAADLVETRPRFVKGTKYVRNASLSPSGARVALEHRGEIITVPAEKGDDRNLTNSVAAHDRSPAWSADGKSIAWFSDESGEYQLFIQQQDGKSAPRKIALNGSGFYNDPRWSPDGTNISFSDNARTLFVLDVPTGTITKVNTQPLYRPGSFDDTTQAWSPDSKWLAYVKSSTTYMGRLNLYSVDTKQSHPVTDGYSNASHPVFDPNGKYLYFLSSTNAGPTQDWFSMSGADMLSTSSIYLAVLPKGVQSPLAQESDEEGATAEDEKKDDKKDDKKKEKVDVKVDFDGLSQRIVALPVAAGGYSSLGVGKTGEVYYLKSVAGQNRFTDDEEKTLYRFKLKGRKEESLAEKLLAYEISNDTKKVFLRMKDSFVIAELGDKVDPSKNKLAVDRIEVRIDPRAEWNQIFNEAWRINRDYFYDPNMHGVNWKAMRDQYGAMLGDLSVRQDLNRVMRWMSSELGVGHHRLAGGDTLASSEARKGGLLGTDYAVDNGRYRFAKVYGGLNWNPELRSPLTEPGVDVKSGEYLLAVEGKELRYPENLYSRFERTAGRIIEITVAPTADGKSSRTVKVVPIENESTLRNRDWVEGNLRKVTEATNGRVAYVYVPNTSTAGHEYFKRYFFPQTDREAIIVDERHNGGGQVADYYIDLLRRPFISNWALRYGDDLRTPLAAIHGPKVMIADETAGSGGDLLPWMFQKLELGPVIGKRTWGGLVGILGYPVLMDGGNITAPNLAIWTEDGWIVENQGVPPDIEVDQTPADVIAGRDPQLERAIAEVMKQLQANPTKRLTRPAYPRRGSGR